MSLWTKVKRFSDEDNGPIEILHHPEPIVPGGETNCKVVQRHRSIRVPLWAKVKCISIENNRLIEVLRRS
jgi:hypothetical protein